MTNGSVKKSQCGKETDAFFLLKDQKECMHTASNLEDQT